jgi:hypothetical protein
MNKFYILITLILFSISSNAQNDFVLLKKNDRTIQRFFKDNSIDFYTKDGNHLSGIINKFHGDTLYLAFPQTRMVMTQFGTTMNDTTGFNYFNIPLRDISIIAANRLSAATVGNIILKIGVLAASIILINKIHVNGLPQNTYAVQYGAGILLNVGMLFINPFKQHHPSGFVIGKKYQLVEINMPDGK